jgi:hypothetical protein
MAIDKGGVLYYSSSWAFSSWHSNWWCCFPAFERASYGEMSACVKFEILVRVPDNTPPLNGECLQQGSTWIRQGSALDDRELVGRSIVNLPAFHAHFISFSRCYAAYCDRHHEHGSPVQF